MEGCLSLAAPVSPAYLPAPESLAVSVIADATYHYVVPAHGVTM
jgi:hypothetical protein